MDHFSTQGNMVNLILSALHEKSPREQLHSSRVSVLCKKLGKAMKLSEKEIVELGLIGLMHDIGKIVISGKILNKTSALTETEWMEMRRHSEVGYRILNASKSMAYIAEYVLWHHERLDGKGYPHNIAGKDIPLQSRILAVADTFDAMVNDRSYKKSVSESVALQELSDCSGVKFDPEVVVALFSLVDKERAFTVLKQA